METIYYICRNINKHPNSFKIMGHVDKRERKEVRQSFLEEITFKQRGRNYPKSWVKDIPEKEHRL